LYTGPSATAYSPHAQLSRHYQNIIQYLLLNHELEKHFKLYPIFLKVILHLLAVAGNEEEYFCDIK